MAAFPPFCPNIDCDFHDLVEERRERWWIRRGTHPNRQVGPVQRFRCTACGKTFSSRTFSVHFATQVPIDLMRLLRSVNSASGIRDMAREFGVTEKVILNRLSRMARQALGLHAELRREIVLTEDLAADGFESFVGSQYWPNNFTLLVGAESQYLYSVDYAQLRRKGRMTDAQRRRRDELNRTVALASGQTERSFARIVSEIGYLWGDGSHKPVMTLSTDRHRSYHRVVTGDRELSERTASGRFVHLRIDSRSPRTRANPLFSVNYFDREIRKDQACHVRETVQWSRDVNHAMDRIWLYGVWHNCFKARRIRDPEQRTHAEHAGAPMGTLERGKRSLFCRRYFFSHLSFSDSMWRTWVRGWVTPEKLMAPKVPAYVMA